MSRYEDERIKRLGRRLRAIYAQAEKELTEKVNSFFADFERLDAQKLELVKAGKLSEKAYKQWRKNKILMAEKYIDLRDTIAETMRKANEVASAYINHELPPVYAHNFNQVGRNIERQVRGYSFDLVNPETVRNLSTANRTLLPYKIVDGRRDVRWNTKKVNTQILQGILQGESAPMLARRLAKNIPTMNRESAMRNARTAVTSAQNKGRFDAMEQAQEDGVIMKKEWIATQDARVRDAHEELDRVQIDINKPFENSIGRIMYPGDPNASPANVYNCRCALAEVVVGFRKKGGK